jgi:hypothetical protein
MIEKNNLPAALPGMLLATPKQISRFEQASKCNGNCTASKVQIFCRKPAVGMQLKAAEEEEEKLPLAPRN